jgi:hypothetical protein
LLVEGRNTPEEEEAMNTCGTCETKIEKGQKEVATRSMSFHADYRDCQKGLSLRDKDKIGILIEGGY